MNMRTMARRVAKVNMKKAGRTRICKNGQARQQGRRRLSGHENPNGRSQSYFATNWKLWVPKRAKENKKNG